MMRATDMSISAELEAASVAQLNQQRGQHKSIESIENGKSDILDSIVNLSSSLNKISTNAFATDSPSVFRALSQHLGTLDPNDGLANVSTQSAKVHSSTMSQLADINQTGSQFSTGQSIEIRNYSSYEELELLSANWQVVLVILYSLTAAIALVGNVISIWVLMTGKRSSKELRIFLVNLSLSDITMALFSIPFTYTDFMLGRWIFAPAFCPVVQLMQMTSVFVSVYTLTAIGIDRYIAIIYPLLSARYNRSFGSLTVLIIWMCGSMLGLVQWANTQATPFLIANETNYDCKEIWSTDESQAFTFSLFIITFALPMCILTYAYGSVALKIFRHSTPGNADLARDKAQHSSKIKIIKMLATIVILFAICWLPLHILNLFIYFARDFMVTVYNSQLGFNVYVTIAITAHWFSMANSFVNPIIYCFMSENFRADLRLLLRKCLRRSPFYSGQLRGRHRQLTTFRNSETCRSTVFATSVRQHNEATEYVSLHRASHNTVLHHSQCRERASLSSEESICDQQHNATANSFNVQSKSGFNHCRLLPLGQKAKRKSPDNSCSSVTRGAQIKLWIRRSDPQTVELCNESVLSTAATPATAASVATTTTQHHGPLSESNIILNRHTSDELHKSGSNGYTEHLCLTSLPIKDGNVENDALLLPPSNSKQNCREGDPTEQCETSLDAALCPFVKGAKMQDFNT